MPQVIRDAILSTPRQPAGRIVQETCRLLGMTLDDTNVRAVELAVQVTISMEQHFTEIAGRAIVAHGDPLRTDSSTCRRILAAILSTAVDVVDRPTS